MALKLPRTRPQSSVSMTRFKQTELSETLHEVVDPGSLTTDGKLENVRAAIAENPQTSIRRLSAQSGLSVRTVHFALRSELRLDPYRINFVPELR
jgi:hypothetical protein